MSDVESHFPDGAAYERLMGRWSQLAGQAFLDWVGPDPGQRWLDVGCGNGAFSEVIARHARPSALTGIDPASAQVDYARNRLPEPHATFHVGDALALPFDDESFDVAVMALVIAFVPDPARAVSELARVTRAGGTVATYMWDLPGGGLPLAPLFRALARIGRSGGPPNGDASTSAALEQLWRGAGLSDLSVTTIDVTVRFDDFDDFWASSSLPAGPQAAVLAALTPAELEAVQDHLRADLPTDGEGRIAYTARANAVTGRRPA